jgi:hypothetical protein
VVSDVREFRSIQPEYQQSYSLQRVYYAVADGLGLSGVRGMLSYIAPRLETIK